MLDIPRLQRIRLSRRPLTQRVVGQLLRLNYGLLPGVPIHFENAERLPPKPVIFAMNHTDRYNYFPFQVYMWQNYDRFTTTWVKGKYYESALLGAFMEKTNQLPTVSRGYIITKDFVATLGRKPTNDEYQALSRWVASAASSHSEPERPATDEVPEPLLSENRDVLGYAFDPSKDDYPGYVNTIFRIMMKQFIELNEEAIRSNLDILVFPQGTRSIRLLPGRIGISQIALHTRLPVVPVGCNGSDRVYPGSSPFAKRGRIVYRIGEPIDYDDISQFHPGEEFEPFSVDAETRYREAFEGLADLVTSRIDALLDEPYQLRETAGSGATQGTDRFI